jgi:hypothetical protein
VPILGIREFPGISQDDQIKCPMLARGALAHRCVWRARRIGGCGRMSCSRPARECVRAPRSRSHQVRIAMFGGQNRALRPPATVRCRKSAAPPRAAKHRGRRSGPLIVVACSFCDSSGHRAMRMPAELQSAYHVAVS